jgi:hypothetical protein
MQNNDFIKIVNKVRHLNEDDRILSEGAWSDLWNGTKDEKRSDQANKDAFDAYQVDKWEKKFLNQGLAPEDARKYAYRKVFTSPEAEKYYENDDTDTDESGMTQSQKDKFDKLYKELKDSPEHNEIKSKNQSQVQSSDEYHAMVKRKAMEDTDFSNQLERIITNAFGVNTNEDDVDHPGVPEHYTAKGQVTAILQKYPAETKKMQQDGDVFAIYDTELYMALFEYFSEDMPYGTQKGRDGDPVVYINDELDSLGLLDEVIPEATSYDDKDAQHAGKPHAKRSQHVDNVEKRKKQTNEDGTDENKFEVLHSMKQKIESLKQSIAELTALDSKTDSSGSYDLMDQITTMTKLMTGLEDVIARSDKIVPKAFSEGKQKPYVSSADGKWTVIDGNGNAVGSSTNKEEATKFFNDNYDDLVDPKPKTLKRTQSDLDYMKQMDDTHALIYGESATTYFNKSANGWQLIPEGYKKLNNGLITKVLK